VLTIKVYWAMRSSFAYRSLPVHAAAFSPDATLVALAHGSAVTLWDTQSNLLIRALDAVDARKVAFTSSEGRYLVAGGAHKGVSVWDLLSCQVVQTLPAQAVDVLLPLHSGFIAAQSGPNTTVLAFFKPDGTAGRSITVKATFSVLTTLPSPSVHLVGIAPSGEIYRFGDMQTSAAPAARNVSNAAGPSRRATSIWQEMFGKDAFLDDLELAPEPAEAAVAVSALQRRAAGHPEQVFDGPSHTLPPVGMLFEAFMDELLVSREEAEAEASEAIEIDEAAGITAAPLSLSSDAVRKVRDDEMAELETFFSSLISSAPKKSAPAKPASAPAQKKSSKANGVKTSTAASTPSKASAAEDEPEVVDGKRKSKKRKAPRTSQV